MGINNWIFNLFKRFISLAWVALVWTGLIGDQTNPLVRHTIISINCYVLFSSSFIILIIWRILVKEIARFWKANPFVLSIKHSWAVEKLLSLPCWQADLSDQLKVILFILLMTLKNKTIKDMRFSMKCSLWMKITQNSELHSRTGLDLFLL